MNTIRQFERLSNVMFDESKQVFQRWESFSNISGTYGWKVKSQLPICERLIRAISSYKKQTIKLRSADNILYEEYSEEGIRTPEALLKGLPISYIGILNHSNTSPMQRYEKYLE